MSDINKALVTPNGQPSKWAEFCAFKSAPDACIHCAWGNCPHSGTTRVKTKKGHRDVNHKTGLSKAEFNRWLSAQKAPAKTAPVSTAPVSTAPVVASTSGAPASTEIHALNDVPGFDLLPQDVKERLSKEVNDQVGASQTYRKFTFWDDAAWAVVEPIAIKKVLEELVKRPPPRPHTGGGHPNPKGGKKGGRR